MTELDDDAQIMQRVQAGQCELFEILVRRYQGALVRAAWSKLGNQAWAEDVAQETFLAAYAARASYRAEFSFRTWLWTILLNLCKRQWKRREQRPLEYGDVESRTDVAAEATVTEETALAVLLSTEERERMAQWLERLPEVQADALRLRYFGGLKFEEIAAAMGSSLGAAKIRVKNGLLAMAEWLRVEERAL